jgi:hypothetical protein
MSKIVSYCIPDFWICLVFVSLPEIIHVTACIGPSLLYKDSVGSIPSLQYTLLMFGIVLQYFFWMSTSWLPIVVARVHFVGCIGLKIGRSRNVDLHKLRITQHHYQQNLPTSPHICASYRPYGYTGIGNNEWKLFSNNNFLIWKVKELNLFQLYYLYQCNKEY